MYWVWDGSKDDFAEFFLNVIIGLIPGCVLLLLALIARITAAWRWKTGLPELVPVYGELGPISRINRSAWPYWRQSVCVTFSLLSLVFFLLTMLLVQIQNAENADPDRWRSLGCFVFCIDGCIAMAFYKSRHMSPRSPELHKQSLRSLQIFWVFMTAALALRIYSASKRFSWVEEWNTETVGWALIWLAEPIVLVIGSLVGFWVFWHRGYQRDKVLEVLKETMFESTLPLLEDEVAALEKACTAEKRKETPEYGSGLWKTISFAWMEALIRLGNKRTYVFSDFFDTLADDQPAVLYARFKRIWDDRMARGAPKRWTLANVLYKFSLPTTNFAALYKFVYDSLLMLSPVFLNLVLNYMEDQAKDDPTATVLKGLIYVGLMAINLLLQTVLLHQYFHAQYMLGLQMRSALSTAVYEKALRLDRVVSDSDPNSEFSTGKVVNLMAVDTQRVSDLMAYVHITWSAPYQIIITCLLLWFQMKWACFAGIGIMILGIPLTRWVVGKMRKVQRVLMNQKDLRIKQTTESLQGIRAIKFYAWEEARVNEISDTRKTELGYLWKIQLINIGNRTLMVALPSLVAIASFAVYTLGMGEELTPAVAFTSLALFNNLRFPLVVLPNIIASLTEASVTVERIQKYLLLPNLKARTVQPPTTSHHENAVEIHNLTVHLPPQPPLLSNLSLSLKPGDITAVVGRTGCGKTALISTILGDLPTQGDARVDTRGSIAFCAQTAWIQTGTVQENILFSQPFDADRYQKTLEACALIDDLAILADGDQTEIGERGINLSGGQKQRIALARAVYRDADIYIFDDVLSAVDAHVAEHIFKNVMVGLLKKKAVLLVTHRFEVLGKVKQVVFLHEGNCDVFPSLDKAMKNELFRELAAETVKTPPDSSTPAHSTPLEVHTPGEVSLTPTSRWSRQSHSIGQVPSAQAAPPDIAGSPSFVEPFLEGDPNYNSDEDEGAPSPTYSRRVDRNSMVARAASKAFTQRRSRSNRSTTGDESMARLEPDGKVAKKDRIALIEEEKMALGAVGGQVYKAYFKACGNGSWWISLIMLGLLLLAQVVQVLSNFWLSFWSARSEEGAKNHISSNVGLIVYTVANVIYIGVSAAASYALAVAAQRASAHFHRRLLHRMIHATLAFFESTPIGRIISRFAKDMQAIDDTIPMTLYQFLVNLVQIISVIAVICIVLPWLILGVVPMIAIYFYVERLYVNVVRQFRRIESVLRAPVISNFQESFEGASTIRAYQALGQFRLRHMDSLNANLSAIYISNASNRWLAVRLETLGTALIICVALLSVLSGGNLSAALGGLALSYAINCVNGLNWLVRMSGDREANVVAVERVIEYEDDAQCPQEKYDSQLPPDTKQPAPGAIEFKGVCLQYRPGLPFALRDVSFSIPPGQKVGVVGRTGAGKSSLLVALLRLTEINDGEVWIHGLETSPMSVTEIRRSISIIPQESVLFSGSLRRNLDPFDESTDDLLWQTLERACLKGFVDTLPDGLDYMITEGGNNLSAGQRQLLCLARVLLKNSKILLLDEATSAVDPQTDALIQTTIRTEFTQCTILTIAHRIRTVIDYDKIMVMADGRVAEFGPPQELLKNPRSLLSALCKAAGDE